MNSNTFYPGIIRTPNTIPPQNTYIAPFGIIDDIIPDHKRSLNTTPPQIYSTYKTFKCFVSPKYTLANCIALAEVLLEYLERKIQSHYVKTRFQIILKSLGKLENNTTTLPGISTYLKRDIYVSDAGTGNFFRTGNFLSTLAIHLRKIGDEYYLLFPEKNKAICSYFMALIYGKKVRTPPPPITGHSDVSAITNAQKSLMDLQQQLSTPPETIPSTYN